jgi:hypothetical protein
VRGWERNQPRNFKSIGLKTTHPHAHFELDIGLKKRTCPDERGGIGGWTFV